MDQGLTVIICTYNGGERIKAVLESIENQILSYPLELVVVDNASKDNSGESIKSYLNDSGLDWKLVEELNPGLVHARWKGIKESKYAYLLFCDDDNYIYPDYCQKGVELFLSNSGIGIIGGKGIPKITAVAPGWFEEFSHSYAVGDLGKKSGFQPYMSHHYGAGIFFRKEALDQLYRLGFKSVLAGRTQESLLSGEDVELCFAVQLLGYRLYFEDKLIFEHSIGAHRLTWPYYLKLKRGISSSFPILESYKIETYSQEKDFKKHLRAEFWIAIKGIIKSGLLLAIRRKKIHQVNLVVAIEKVKRYFPNYRRTLTAYQRNKKLFLCL